MHFPTIQYPIGTHCMSNSRIQTGAKSTKSSQAQQQLAVAILQIKKKNNLENDLLKIAVKFFKIIHMKMEKTPPLLDYREKNKNALKTSSNFCFMG